MAASPLSPREAHKAQAAAQFALVSRGFGVLVTALVLAVGLRTLVVEAFNIPSESMLPTLAAGDYVLVVKWPYGYSRYSPSIGVPWGSGRIGGHPPERGDVVVFKTPRDNRTDFIKRVIGLPGDRVRLTGGRVELNDTLVPRVRNGDFAAAEAGPACRDGSTPRAGVCRYPRYVETLGHRRYNVVDEVGGGPGDDTPLATVPPGHYFVLGDNRDDSADSRLSIADGGVGMVPATNLLGRAEIVFFSTAAGSMRADRIGTRP